MSPFYGSLYVLDKICSLSPRLAPFVLVFAVIEELIPVIILYAPGFLPSTCKLQPQQDRIDNLADDKRYEALSDAQTLLKKLPSSVVESSEMSVHELPAELVPLMCKYVSIFLLSLS